MMDFVTLPWLLLIALPVVFFWGKVVQFAVRLSYRHSRPEAIQALVGRPHNLKHPRLYRYYLRTVRILVVLGIVLGLVTLIR